MFDDIPLLVSIAALAATVFLALTLYAWRAEIWFAWRSVLRASRTPPWRLSRGIGLTVGLGLALGAGLLLGGCGTIGVGQPTFPGLFGRGLIEAQMPASSSSRGRQAFPGLFGRGLIEAPYMSDRASDSRNSFPGLFGRGLIEAHVNKEAQMTTANLFPRPLRPGPH